MFPTKTSEKEEQCGVGRDGLSSDRLGLSQDHFTGLAQVRGIDEQNVQGTKRPMWRMGFSGACLPRSRGFSETSASCTPDHLDAGHVGIARHFTPRGRTLQTGLELSFCRSLFTIPRFIKIQRIGEIGARWGD